MKKVKFEIITDKWEQGLPTYFILKSIYYFRFNLVGELYGVNSCPNTPFQDLESAEEYLKLLKNE